MPTNRPRHVVTEVDEIAAALDEAARIWPEYRDQRGKLLHRLITEGYKVIHDQHAEVVRRRRAAIQASAGSMSDIDTDGLSSVDFVRQMRDNDWPE